MPSLPELSYRDFCRLIEDFSRSVKGVGSPRIKGLNRQGDPFSFHAHPGQRVRPDQLRHAIRYLGLTLEEFWSWHGK